jgi:hypothetical protein
LFLGKSSTFDTREIRGVAGIQKNLATQEIVGKLAAVLEDINTVFVKRL